MSQDPSIITSHQTATSNVTAISVRRGQFSQNRSEQRLPFTIRIASDEQTLQKAVGIRHAAYGRHLPELAEKLNTVEQADFVPGTVILLAESKLDGSSLGTMRIQTNRFHPLGLEQSVTLPPWLQGRRLAEATRLGVAGGRIGKVVKSLLFKAYFQYCLENEIEWMVITARSPLDRQYTAMLFEDVFPGLGFIPMSHVGNLSHRILAFEVETVEVRWKAVAHPLFHLIFELYHPDVMLNSQPRVEKKRAEQSYA